MKYFVRTHWCRLLFGAVVSALAIGANAQAQKLVHSERSMYREVLVYESKAERCMCFTKDCRIGRQSCMDVKRPDRIVMNYPQMMLGALFLQPEPRSVLVIGLGGGTIPRALTQLIPHATIDVVEIDPAVVRVAKDYFGFVESSKVRSFAQDGRVFVKRALREQRKYDLVMLDAFDHEYIPEHLLTREFIQETRRLLSSNGVLVANTFSSSRLYDHESATYAAVFPTFFNLKRDNRIIIASAAPLPFEAQLRANADHFNAAFDRLDIDVDRLLPLFSTKQDWRKDARVLTDQFSPANLMNLSE